MISFPNAKINLGLNIIGRRSDGYHLLETLFYPIPMTDTLEVYTQSKAESDRLTVYGNDSLGATEDNLVLRAVRALREVVDIPPLDIYLYKRIPSGAGMGGGSADASFMLTMLTRELGLGLSDKELHRIALTLGADCPFFINNTTAIGKGIGEELESYPLTLSGYRLVLLKPDLHISTAKAFSGLGSIARWHLPLEKALERELSEWRDVLHNDFERSLFPLYPCLPELKSWLYAQGAIYASMTGSGSVIYGLFKANTPTLTRQNEFTNTEIWEIDL